MNYYELLNVSKDADNNQIKKQYYKLAKEYHPDKTKGDKDKESKFIKIQQAYDTLIDEGKRKSYNMTLYEDELFDNIANFFTYDYDTEHTAHKRNKQSSKDDFYTLEITIPEYLNGIHRTEKVSIEKICETCNQTGIKDYKVNTRRCEYCNGTGLDLNIPLFACGICNGKCVNVINNIPCEICEGKCTYKHEEFINIKSERLINEATIIESGGYKFKVKYSFSNEIVDSHIIVKENMSVIKWLCGDEFTLKLYDDEFICVKTLGAFDLSKDFLVRKNIKLRFGLKLINQHIELLRKCAKLFVSIFKRNKSHETSFKHVDLTI